LVCALSGAAVAYFKVLAPMQEQAQQQEARLQQAGQQHVRALSELQNQADTQRREADSQIQQLNAQLAQARAAAEPPADDRRRRRGAAASSDDAEDGASSGRRRRARGEAAEVSEPPAPRAAEPRKASNDSDPLDGM
jgi:hypothetical protein